MNNKALNVLLFATGAALGSVVTLKLFKSKYERYAQEEINSMKKYYSDKAAYKSANQEIGYTPNVFAGAINDTVLETTNNKEEAVTTSNGTWARVSEKIYMITPEELGEFDEYDVVGLSYYEEDHVLADNDGNRVDFDVIGGKDMIDNIGEYEEDVLQVRNDTHRTDYEIYLVHDSYFDAYSRD